MCSLYFFSLYFCSLYRRASRAQLVNDILIASSDDINVRLPSFVVGGEDRAPPPQEPEYEEFVEFPAGSRIDEK